MRAGSDSAALEKGGPGRFDPERVDHFRVAPCDDRVWKSFYPVETQIGSFIRDLCKREGAAAAERIYVDQDMATNSVVQYLAHGIRVNTFRAEASASRWAGSGPMLTRWQPSGLHDLERTRSALTEE